MNSKLYVSNLRWTITDDDLVRVFEKVGTVESAEIVLDRETGRSRGFGFVVMASPDEAGWAIETLNGKYVGGRQIIVKEAVPENKSRLRFEGTVGGDPNNPFREKNKILVECPNCH